MSADPATAAGPASATPPAGRASRVAGPAALGLALLLGFAAGAVTATGTWLARDGRADGCVLTANAPLRLAGCDLRAADLSRTDLRRADLRAASLDGKNLSGLDLTGADLRAASMPETVLRKAVLQGARLQGVDLRGAFLEGACLRGVDVTASELAGQLAAAPALTATQAPSAPQTLTLDNSACR